MDRCLQRLVRMKYIRRFPRRFGSDDLRGGAGQADYQLTGSGWRQAVLSARGRETGDSDSYRASRSISPHALKIADVAIAIRQQERLGLLTVLHLGLEEPVGQVQADIALQIGIAALRVRRSFYIEVDLGTEGREILRKKCLAYVRAWEASSARWFPRVLYVVPYEVRVREIERIVESLYDGGELFEVCTFEDAGEVLTGLRSITNS